MPSQGQRAELEPQAEGSASLPSGDEASDAAPGSKLDELLERVAQPTLPAIERPFSIVSDPAPPALRTARVTRMTDGAGVEITLRGADQPTYAVIDEGVDRDLVVRAMENRDAVLIEIAAGQDPAVVGVVQTRVPQRLELKAKDIVVDGEREVVIRAGRSAVRMRADGDLEVVGSRILTMSRGLFRIVGRVLRLS
jgi:hypothetical protein